MRLRSIELHGFKSFRAKSGIEVGEGITAIVGPNGCGKSNIVDAVRWAMGTQSARSLRGNEMLDVIFAGSRTRKPAGLAEVILTFENDATRYVSSGDLARSPVRAMAEGSSTLTVSRRLHRSGDSEYLINGVKVRLKDVNELFLGTGASVRGYSIIEQGQIEFLVNARPSERRTFVEELAGVTRYRYHRQETERKLGTTQANLERLEDLMSEVKRRIAQLKRQANQAERYAGMMARKRKLEVGLLLAAWEREQARLDEVAEQLTSTRDGFETAAAQLEEAEAVESSLEAGLRECESAHRALTEDVYRLRTKRDLLEQSVTHASQSRERLLGERERLDSDEREIRDEIEELGGRRQALDEQIEAKRADAPQADASLREAAEAATVALARADARVEALDGQLREAARELAHEKALTGSRREELERLQTQRASWSERHDALEGTLEARRERLATLVDDEIAADEAVERAQHALAAAELGSEEGRRALEASRRALDESRHEQASRRARREAMAESATVEAGEGARKVLEAAEIGELEDVLGLVGDGIIAPPELEAPLHGVLRDLLEYVVVDGADAARRVLAFAADEGVVVGCIERRQGGEARQALEGSLLPQLSIAEWVPVAVRQVLAGAVTVESLLDEAQTIDAGCLVDAAGHCANAHGFWRSGDPGGGVVARRARLLYEMSELDDAIVALDERQEQLKRACRAAEARVEEATHLESAKRRALESLRDEKADLAAQKQRIEAEIEAAREQIAEHERIRERDQTRLDELQAALASAQTQATAHEERIAAIETQRDEARRERDEKRLERDRRQQAWAESQAAQRQYEAELQRLVDNRRQLDETEARAQQRLDKLDRRRGEIAEQATRADIEIEANRSTAAEVAQTLATAEDHLAGASERLEALRRDHQAHLDAVKGLRRSAGRLRAELDRLALCETQARRELEHAEDGLGQHHGMTVGDARETLDGFELPDQAKQLVLQLTRDIDALGPINHAALEELDEATQRHDFLCQQQADLMAAIDDMRLTIDELDHASRSEFLKTFVAVREEFEALFRRLFRGGEATMELTDEADPLEAGVEVIVRPPGKNVRSMTLLSGGEKALTAVALVFAAFRLKPSPFCVLDEVDAPLDDHNVERFVALIDELSDETQFIVITHNRRTMEGAHKLVGVTMEEPGSSKLVAVNVPSPRRPSVPLEERAAS